jgi:hypothetical protein
MKAQLAALQPELEARSAATAVLLQQVSRDQAQAEAAKATVAAEEREVKAMAESTQVGWAVGWGGVGWGGGAGCVAAGWWDGCSALSSPHGVASAWTCRRLAPAQ